MATTISQVNQAIMFGDFTNEQLESIISAIKFRRSEISKTNKRAFGVGSRVQFHSTKRNQTITGTVEKVAIKFVTVNTGTGRWKVPANMLQATGA